MKIFSLFLSGIALFHLSPFFPITTFILFISLSALLMKNTESPPSKGRIWKKLSLSLLVLSGFTYAFLRHSPPVDISALSNRDIILTCTAESMARESMSGRLLNDVKVVSATDAGDGTPLTLLEGREMNIVSEKGMPQHMRYVLAVRTEKDRERRNPGALKNEGLYATLVEVRAAEPLRGNAAQRWLQDRRDQLNLVFKNRFKGDSGAFLASQTTGERAAMSEEIKDAFNSTGLAHVLSISGTHFGLFSALIFGLFRFILRSMPHRVLQRFTLYLSPSQAAALLALPLMLFYLLLSGTSFPALRSFIMINLFLLGLLIGRKGHWLNSLLFAAFVICAWDPSALLSISFQLSFLAVFCIGLFLIEGHENADQGFLRRAVFFLKSSVLLSLSASLGTALLVAYYFHYFSIISPVANFFITPFICFILVPLSLLSSFIFIFSGHYPFQALVASLSDMALGAVKFFASAPFADVRVPAFPPIVVILFYAGLVVFFLSGKKRYTLALPVGSLLLCLLFLLYGRNAPSVTYLDVGQGDAAVIEGYGKTVVIDTGRTGRELEGYLRYLGRGAVDALVLTHADDDHAAGALFVMKKVRVREVWDNGLITYPENLLRNAVHRSLERGDEVSAGNFRVQTLHPYRGFYTFSDNDAAEENNESLVVKVGGKKFFLFTGDASEEAEQDMLRLGAWLRSDVLKVSHHGSRTSSSEDFVKAVSPEVAVISVGRDNPYGHPHAETLERLRGARIYRTDRDGAVKVTVMPEGLRVQTCQELMFERVKGASGEGRNIVRLFRK
jgi:competence protein ComEC